MAPERTDALVGIAREALTNAARHSGSRQVSLSLCRAGGRVLMRVRDSGRGFDPASPRGGFGVTSMRHRARSVGGDVRISSRPGAGSEVEAAL
jgi:signal transduction histidine kinase